MEGKVHAVYCFRKVSGAGRRKTYVGYTNNIGRRLHQHNGEIAGGAKATRGARWEYMFYVEGFPDRATALSCEKRFHLLRTRDRPAGLACVLSMPRWKRSQGDIVPGTLALVLRCEPGAFRNVALPANIRVERL